jgi:DNA (cytosine-5)-methyltransferase 1
MDSLTQRVQNSIRHSRRETVGAKFDGRVPFNYALNSILKVTEERSFTNAVKTNLRAVISHWLQSSDDTPLILGKAVLPSWNRILRAYYSPASGKNEPLRSYKEATQSEANIDFSGFPFPPVRKPKFTFIDIFAGIGGFRLALQSLGGKCVFSSEWDRNAQQTYLQNFGEVPFGDIREFTHAGVADRQIRKLIPDHDILAAGFPCQPFSKAGVSARSALGQKHGFSCKLQGTLFFDLIRIAKAKRPRVIVLENVWNLRSHNGERTFRTIQNTIERDLGYSFWSDVIDASSLVPQRRRRCYMICFRDPETRFSFTSINRIPSPLRSVLECDPHERYTISDRLWEGHIKRSRRNVDRGAGFSAYEADLDKPANTLVARYYKDGKECLIPQRGKNPRMLTPRECARLQGFPEEFKPHPVNKHAYIQFGNSIAVPLVAEISKRVLAALDKAR